MKKLTAAAVAATLFVSGAFAADIAPAANAPLAPGNAAGVKSAQMMDNTALIVVGAAVVIAGVALAASSGSSGGTSTPVPVVVTTTTTG